MTIPRRLQRLEQRTTGTVWCRCPWSWERSNEEVAAAMLSGEPTPSQCDACRGQRVSIQYMPSDKPQPGAIACTLTFDRELAPVGADEDAEAAIEAVEAELSRRREIVTPAPEFTRVNSVPESAPEPPDPPTTTAAEPAPYDGLAAWSARMHEKRRMRGW